MHHRPAPSPSCRFARLAPALALALALPGALAAAGPAAERPEIYPLCTSPQPIAPAQDAFPSNSSPSSSSRQALAWNGREYGAAWGIGGSSIAFASLYADGTIRAFTQPVTGVAIAPSTSIDMAWDGAQYGIAVTGRAAGDTVDQIYLLRLSRDGALLGAALRVSQAGSTPSVNAANPQLAAFSDRFVIVWNDPRSGTQDIYASVAGSTGTMLFNDLLVSTGPAVGDQTLPVIAPMAVFPTYQIFLIAWQDGRSGTKTEIYTSYGWATSGVIFTNFLAASPPAGNATQPALVARGNGAGLAWTDTRDGGAGEIYFAALTDNGQRTSSETRLTNDANASSAPRLAWTGGEYEVAWYDARTTANPIYLQRVADDATPVGGNVKLGSLAGAGAPALAWAGPAFAVLASKNGWSQMQFGAYGCVADATPASCGGNYLAYSITGATASISWSPAQDPESGIAYYQLYRNNTPLAKTSDGFFNDSGLSLGTTYNYFVQPVNAYQLQNANCTSSIYLKTNASLTLTMGKSAPDAQLSWNDIGWNNYNVFRGTDPRTMTLTGATAATATTDPGALADQVSYFYTVDDPGQ